MADAGGGAVVVVVVVFNVLEVAAGLGATFCEPALAVLFLTPPAAVLLLAVLVVEVVVVVVDGFGLSIFNGGGADEEATVLAVVVGLDVALTLVG